MRFGSIMEGKEFRMIIGNPREDFFTRHFIFIGDDILLDSSDSLPDEDVVQKCIDGGLVKDSYAEVDADYSAFMLKEGSSVPEGCKTIPLRHFFWIVKSDEEKKNAVVSKLGGLAARAHRFLMLRAKYRFCPVCGKPLSDDDTFNARKCGSCGKIFFPQIEPAVIVLVSRGDEILLVKDRKRATSFFSCVAGFVEHGESLEQSVEREVMEETGISIKNIRYVGSQPWPFPDQLMLAFTADYASGEIRLQEEELVDGGWFKRDSLPEIPRPGSVAYNLIMGFF